MLVSLFDFAIKTILRDFKTYLYYFLNCIFSVLIFFLFSVLSFHPTLKIIDAQSTLGFILISSEFISILFSTIFIAYSVNNFLKSRSRHFGLISIIGCSKKQLNTIIFFENATIGFMAILSGISLGIILSKLFLLIAAKLIRNIELGFYFPIKAILLTTIVLGLIFTLISYITPKFLRKQKILALIKKDAQPEDNSKVMNYMFTLFLILISIAFFQNKIIVKYSFMVFPYIIINILLFIVTNYIILCKFIDIFIKINVYTGKYYRKTNMIAISNIQNTKVSTLQTLTLCTILYCITLLSIIFMSSSAVNVELQTKKITPQTFLYMPWTQDAPVNNDLKIIETELKNFPGYKKLESKVYITENNKRQAIMPTSEYNQIATFLNYDKISLASNEAYVVSGNVKQELTKIPEYTKTAIYPYTGELKINGHSQKLIALSGVFNSITILSDDTFKKLYTKSYPVLIESNFYSYNLDNWTIYNNVGKEITSKLKNTIDSRKAAFISAPHYYENDRLTKNLIFYVGSIMCFSFILAMSSFIYSKLYSNIEKDCEKYKNIIKLGLSKKELFKILSSNLKLIIFTPFVLSIVYMWIGVLFVEKYIIISNIPITAKYTIIYTFIQVVLYIIIKKSYQKNIEKGVYINQ